jgi:hypothetical protein
MGYNDFENQYSGVSLSTFPRNLRDHNDEDGERCHSNNFGYG